MKKAFYNKIINLIPSADLKAYVKSHDFKFDEKSLLSFILEYVPTFDKKLALFEEAATELSDINMRKLALKRISFENKQYEEFMRTSPNAVYQIKIKIAPDDAEEDTYIVATFDDAVAFIKSYLKCYDIKLNDCKKARYTLSKKTTTVPVKPNDISKGKTGTLGECVLDCKFRILSLYMYGSKSEVPCKKGVICDECRRCINVTSTRFPHFLKKYDLVAFYDDLLYDPAHLTYGIFGFDMDKIDDDSYVVLLEDNEYIKNRSVDFKTEEDYYRVGEAHWHPSYCEIIKPDIKDVPKQIYEDYIYASSGLKSLDEGWSEQS